MVRVGTILFLDCEIIREVPWPDQERMPGVEYCEGWQDFTGMGIACVGVIEAKLWSTSQPYGFRGLEIRGARVFGTGYLDSLPDHLNRHAGVVTFNGLRFDVPLLAAHGIELLPETPHLDLGARGMGCRRDRRPDASSRSWTRRAVQGQSYPGQDWIRRRSA